MTKYRIEPKVFEMFPDFRRVVLIARDIDNRSAESPTAQLLTEIISSKEAQMTDEEQKRIAVWNSAYEKFGANPNKFTPSIRFLMEQLRRGKPPRSINKIVDLFNITSLKWGVPCGGDDLDALQGGDMVLGIANGDEIFAPLFKPDAIENPIAGEIIYYTPQSKRVMCRRWTWRNADFSKLTENTKRVAVNIDMMLPPFNTADLQTAAAELTELIRKFCGGEVKTYVLGPDMMEIPIEV